MTTKHSLPACTILDGKVHVFMREGSPYWWVGFHYKGKYLRKTSKQSDLGAAKAFAKDWFFKKQTEIASGCWRRLNLDSECRFFLDRGLAANIWMVDC